MTGVYSNKMEICIKDEFSSMPNISNKKYKCIFEGCTLKFLKPSRLSWHMNVHLNKRPFKCTFEGCDKSYSSPSHLKRHTLNHNGTTNVKKYKCKFCKGYFSNTSNLKRHIDRTHSDTAKVCTQCNKRFRKENLYEEHMAFYHSLKSHPLKAYECEECGKILLTFTAFKRHKRKHLCKIYACFVKNCKAQFYSLSLLQEHKKISHVFRYTCADCDRVFHTKHYLRNHVLTHSDKRPKFHCTYENCTRYYYFKKNLSQHISLAHKGKTFKCDICNFGLSTKQKLNQHMIKIHQAKKKIHKKKEPRKTVEFLSVFIKEDFTED